MPPRIVLITGANSSVGLATVKVLTSHSSNYHVVIAARSLSKAESAKSEVESENPDSAFRLSMVQLDVTDVESILHARDFVEKEFGHLDVLINNAAVGGLGSDVAFSFKKSMETNVTGPAVMADVFRPLLLKSANPYSIFVSSGAGSFGRTIQRFEGSRERQPEPVSTYAYHVSKAALNMIALQEYTRYSERIKVFAMSPGFVVSNLRGTTEELRTGWGKAGPASAAGETMLDILEGKRDQDVGKLIRKDGVDDW